MKLWQKIKEKSWFSYSVAICIGIAFYMILNNIVIFGNFFYGLWTWIKPLLYGLILAYLIDPIARFYENKPFKKVKKDKPRRTLSVVLATITVVVVIGGLAAAVIPSLADSISNIFERLADFIKDIDANAGHLSSNLPFGLGEALSNISISGTILEKASNIVTKNIQGIADTSVTIGSGFANLIIAFILAIYYMMDKDRLKTMAKRGFVLVLKEKRYNVLYEFAKKTDVILLQYIKGNLIEAIIVGVVNAIFMLIGRLPYVLLISIVVGITNIAPTFGPIVGALIGAVMLVLVNPWYALAFLIFTVVLQTIDGYILKPRLFGETLGVSPLLILIFIILGGRLWGVIGILLAIPLAAIAQYVWDSIWAKYKKNKAGDLSLVKGLENGSSKEEDDGK